MASKTRVTSRIRRRKVAKKGQSRKRVLRRDGSTQSQAALFGDTK
jgi:hypothetical protein